MIGQKIRERRTGLNISLRELGKQTGLSASFLSQVENDQADPSISSLQNIARALKVPMFTFLDQDNHPEQVVRHDARKQLSFPDPHIKYELLTNDLNRQMAGFLIHLKSGESHHAQQLYKSTEEMMVCRFRADGNPGWGKHPSPRSGRQLVLRRRPARPLHCLRAG